MIEEKCLGSVLIEKGVSIEILPTDNLRRAKSYDLKRGRILFRSNNEGKHPIPEGFKTICFPHYHRHGDRYINHGDPVFDNV